MATNESTLNETETESNTWNSLVFSSGSIYGVSYIGCIRYLEEHNLLEHVTKFVGSSVGSMFAGLLYLGWTSQEFEELLLQLDLTKFQSFDLTEPDTYLRFFTTYGFDSGEKFFKIIDLCIEKKIGTNLTFFEAYEQTKKELVIATTCVNRQQTIYMNYQSHPDVTISEAIKISCRVPFLFDAHEIESELYVDGGISDILPIQYMNEKNALGFFVMNRIRHNHSVSTEHPCQPIKSIKHYAMNIISCLNNQLYNLIESNYENCVCINLADSMYVQENKKTMFNFFITPEQVQEFITLGYQSTQIFLESHSPVTSQSSTTQTDPEEPQVK